MKLKTLINRYENLGFDISKSNSEDIEEFYDHLIRQIYAKTNYHFTSIPLDVSKKLVNILKLKNINFGKNTRRVMYLAKCSFIEDSHFGTITNSYLSKEYKFDIAESKFDGLRFHYALIKHSLEMKNYEDSSKNIV